MMDDYYKTKKFTIVKTAVTSQSRLQIMIWHVRYKLHNYCYNRYNRCGAPRIYRVIYKFLGKGIAGLVTNTSRGTETRKIKVLT